MPSKTRKTTKASRSSTSNLKVLSLDALPSVSGAGPCSMAHGLAIATRPPVATTTPAAPSALSRILPSLFGK